MSTVTPRRMPLQLLLAVVTVVTTALVGVSVGGGARAWTTPVNASAHAVSLLTGSGLDIGRSVAVGSDGSFYVAGEYASPTLSAGALVVTNDNTNGGTNDAFVAKFDPQGDPVWLRSFGGPGVDAASSVVVDASNHVYVAGEFMATATFSASPLVTRSAVGGGDGFVARLDADGTLQWVAVVAGAAGTDSVANLAITPDGSVVAAATVVGAVSVGATTSPATVGDTATGDVVVARFTSTGSVSWSARFGGSLADEAQRIAVDRSGSVLVTARVNGAATIVATDMTQALPAPFGGVDVVVAKLDGDGRLAPGWVRRFGGAGSDVSYGVVADSQARVTVASNVIGDVTVGASVYSVPVDGQILLTQFDPAGTVLWVNAVAEGGLRTSARYLALAPEDRVVTAGFLGRGANTTMSAWAHDASGNQIWGTRELSSLVGAQTAQSVTVDASGNVYITGRFEGGRIDPADPASHVSVWGDSDVPVIMLRGLFPPAPVAPALPSGLAPLVTTPVATLVPPATTPVTTTPITAIPVTTAPADGVDVSVEGLRTSPSGVASVLPGDVLTLNLSGLVPDSDVRVEIFSTPRLLWSGTADADGAVRVEVVVPRDLEPGPHTLRITGLEAAGPFTTDVAVEVVALDDRLPATGVAVPLLLAVAVLVAGLVLVARGRRIARW